jgi:hypothetical protein
MRPRQALQDQPRASKGNIPFYSLSGAPKYPHTVYTDLKKNRSQILKIKKMALKGR